MKRFLILLTLLSAYNASSQSDSIPELKISSNITIPISISFTELEKITNQSLPNLIYSDTSFKDNDNDNLRCNVWKNGTLKMTSSRDNVIDISVPLKVWVERGFGALGLMTYKSTTFQMTMKFTVVYNIHPTWNLMTKTLKNGYTWNQKPSIEFGAVVIPITPIVENILEKNQQEYANTINEQIKKNINLRADITRAWNELKMPILVSDSLKTWLRITPLSIQSTPFILRNNSIESNIGIEVISETFMGVSPVTTPATLTIPNLKYVNRLADSFSIYTISHIPLSEATQIGKNKFIGQQFDFKEGKYHIIVDDIAIKSEQDLLVIETLVHGSINGTILLKGVPYYNPSTQSIKMKQVSFDLKTKNIFIKTFAWLFDGKIERNVESSFDIPTKDIIESSKISTQSALNKTYKNSYKMSGTVLDMAPQSVLILKDKMVLVTKTTGKLKMKM